jgi:hypothetical protein
MAVEPKNQPWLNGDLENLWLAITGGGSTEGLATEETLVEVRDLVDQGNIYLDSINNNSISSLDLLDLINTNLVDELDAVNENLVTVNDSVVDLMGSPTPKSLYNVWLSAETGAVYLGRIADGLSTPLQNSTSGEGFASLADARVDYNSWRNSVSVLVTPGFPQFICDGFTGEWAWIVLFR